MWPLQTVLKASKKIYNKKMVFDTNTIRAHADYKTSENIDNKQSKMQLIN